MKTLLWAIIVSCLAFCIVNYKAIYYATVPNAANCCDYEKLPPAVAKLAEPHSPNVEPPAHPSNIPCHVSKARIRHLAKMMWEIRDRGQPVSEKETQHNWFLAKQLLCEDKR
jgi:hypothetical protein